MVTKKTKTSQPRLSKSSARPELRKTGRVALSFLAGLTLALIAERVSIPNTVSSKADDAAKNAVCVNVWKGADIELIKEHDPACLPSVVAHREARERQE